MCGHQSAAAQGQSTVLRGNGEKAIAVWRSDYAADTGARLANTGQRDLALKYMSCAVPPGTKIVILPGGSSTIRIMIVEGPFRGCEGHVFSYDVHGDKAQRDTRWKRYLSCSAQQEKNPRAEMNCTQFLGTP